MEYPPQFNRKLITAFFEKETKLTLKNFSKYLLSATNPMHTNKPGTENESLVTQIVTSHFFFFFQKRN